MFRFSSAGKWLAVLAAASLWACGGTGGTPPEHSGDFVLRGDAVTSDPKGEFDKAIDFGHVVVGARSTPEILFVNPTKSPVTLRLDASRSLAEPFSVSSRTVELRPGAQRAVQFSFAPTSEGEFESTLDIRVNHRDEVQVLRLVGQAGSLDCEPTEIDLGYVVIGESRSRTFVCENPLSSDVTIVLGTFQGNRPHFSAAFADGTPGNTAVVPAEGSIEIEVSFAAVDESGSAGATLPILSTGGHVIAEVYAKAQAIDHALQVFEDDGEGGLAPLSGCRDFSHTFVGDTEERVLYLKNLGQAAVDVTSLVLSPATPHFELVAPELDEPVTLEPNDALQVNLTYTPQTSELHVTDLVVEATGQRSVPKDGLKVCLRGSSEGPSLRCEPSAIDFGPVAVGTEVTHTLRCTNTAVPPPGAPAPVLYVNDTFTDGSPFSASLRGGTSATGYAPGEFFFVDVRFAPTADGEHEGKVVIDNTTTPAPHLALPLVGEAVNLPPCDFAIEPASLDFGLVEPGQELTLTAYVVNRSTQHECIVSNLHLAHGSDPAFRFEPVHHVFVPPSDGQTTDHRFPVQVTFAPVSVGSHAGAVAFFLSHPQAGAQALVLSGTGGSSCLQIEAQFSEFAGGTPQCTPHEILVSVGNFCAETVRLDAISAGQGPFGLRGVAGLPLELEEGDRFEFAVTFTPESLGPIHGALQVTASQLEDQAFVPIGTFVLPLQGTGHAADPDVIDSWTVESKVDLLIVMDNSAAVPGQVEVPERADLLLGRAYQIGADFQVGVTTTGVAYMPTPSGCPGGFDGSEDGRLFPHPDLGRPRIVHSGMSQAQAVALLQQNLDVGVCHSFEAVYEAMRRAFSSPWLLTPQSEGGNAGFLRSDAALAILAIHEESDPDSLWKGDPSEDRSVARYVEFLKNRKPSWRQDDVKIHMLSGGMTECLIASACPRCVEGTQLTGGLHVENCMTNPAPWDAAISAFSERIFALPDRFVLRGVPADRNGDGVIDGNDIEVRVGGIPRDETTNDGARVWSYDPATKSIEFSPPFLPPAGTTVEVEYAASCN